MTIKTKRFGKIDVDEDKLITFGDGLPGFSSLRTFVLIESDAEERGGLFWWLQSAENADVAFALINVPAFIPEYNPVIALDALDELGEYEEANDFLTLNITVIPDDVTQTRVNLRAPVVINSLTRKGRQIIVSSEEYDTRYFIFDELRKLRQVV
jgi:flagellar assembly factor FliW